VTGTGVSSEGVCRDSVSRPNRLFLVTAATIVAIACAAFPSLLSAGPASAQVVACTTDTFETGLDGWSTHYAGDARRSMATASAGNASLELSGTKGTARRTLSAASCSGPISTITLRARSTATSRLIISGVSYSPNPPFLVPVRPYAGPYDLGAEWQTITIGVVVPETVNFQVETDQPVGVSTFLDTIEYGVAGPSPTTTTTVPPIGACATDTFESGTDRWSTHYAGLAQRSTAAAYEGSAALELTGTKGTARRNGTSPGCTETITTITFRARSSATSRLIVSGAAFDLSPPFLNPPRPYAGPWELTAEWQTITIAVNVPAVYGPLYYGVAGTITQIHVESDQGNEVSTFLDNIEYFDGTAPPTTTPPTTTPPTTTPPTTAPPTGTCRTDTFDSDLQGWTPWWSGSVAVVEQELRLTNAFPVTAQRTILPSECPGLQSITFEGGIGYGLSDLRLYVKTIDLGTGDTRLFGPISYSGGFARTGRYPEQTIPVTVGALGVTIGVEVYSSADQYAIDNVRYNVDSPTSNVPPTTEPPTTVTTTTAATTTTTFGRRQ
jgi:hypothetical protein